MIYLAADHRGFQLKEHIKKHLSAIGFIVEDIGAFEYASVQPPSPSPSPTLPICFSPVDAIINGNDLQAWATNYLSNTINIDINSDNRINSLEFGYLISHWGESCQNLSN